MGKTEEQLRLKLHESFKELISMNETMKRLEKEADRGNDAAEQRNENLQKNLDQLGSDFASETQKLSAATLRIRELEFEIEETVFQFNAIGEAKKKADELNTALSDDLAATTHDLNNTKDELEQTINVKESLESQLKTFQEAHETLKEKLENQIAYLQSDLAQSKALCLNLEGTTTNLRAEVSTLKDSLKLMKSAKENAEANLKAANEKSKRDIQLRDNKIKEHEDARAEDAKKMKSITALREKMRAEVTELQNSLDREVQNHNSIGFEYAQFKRQAEERFLSLEDQIEKLTSTKTNLSNEKKQLSERLKSVRSELNDKDQELEYTKNAYRTQGDTAIANDTKLRSNIATLELALAQLQKNHKELTTNFQNSQNTCQYFARDLDETRKRLAEFEEKDKINCANIADLETKLANMIQSHNQAVQERVAMKIHLDSVISKFEELNSTIRNMESEYTATNKSKDGQITRLSNDLQESRDENERLLSLSRQLKTLSETLDADLLQTRINLEKQTVCREHLELELQKLTTKFNMERKIRTEFERMNSRIGRLDELRSLEKIAALKMRDFKLKEIDTGLTQQLNHLDSIVELLPKDLNFGEAHAEPIPIFNVKSNRANLKAHTTTK
jgi:chromosome segregation ATPase